MMFAIFMGNFAMSLEPQVKTLIKHCVNLRLDIFLQNLDQTAVGCTGYGHTCSNTCALTMGSHIELHVTLRCHVMSFRHSTQHMGIIAR